MFADEVEEICRAIRKTERFHVQKRWDDSNQRRGLRILVRNLNIPDAKAAEHARWIPLVEVNKFEEHKLLKEQLPEIAKETF